MKVLRVALAAFVENDVEAFVSGEVEEARPR